MDKEYIKTEYEGYKIEIIPSWKLCEYAQEDFELDKTGELTDGTMYTRRLFIIGPAKDRAKYKGGYYVWYEKYESKLGYIHEDGDYYDVDLRNGMMSYGFRFKKEIGLKGAARFMAKNIEVAKEREKLQGDKIIL